MFKINIYDCFYILRNYDNNYNNYYYTTKQIIINFLYRKIRKN